ncbi:MAG: YdcH family protein [Gammaproteobacteria bacterium]|nr:MAG: YdcH family protein [Gammaproteobacteria bacterium]
MSELSDEDREELIVQLQELKLEHQSLNEMITRVSHDSYCDQLQLRRLKKRKLHLKDCIAKIESKLIPDLEA